SCFRAWLDLLQHADYGQTPDDAEQPPTPGAAQANQAEGRVAAGDQQVDRQVIQLLHDHLRPPAQAVIKRGGAVQQHQSKAIDRHADGLCGVAAHGGQYQWPDAAVECYHSASQVRPSVESFSVVHRGPARILSYQSVRRTPSWRCWLPLVQGSYGCLLPARRLL